MHALAHQWTALAHRGIDWLIEQTACLANWLAHRLKHWHNRIPRRWTCNAKWARLRWIQWWIGWIESWLHWWRHHERAIWTSIYELMRRRELIDWWSARLIHRWIEWICWCWCNDLCWNRWSCHIDRSFVCSITRLIDSLWCSIAWSDYYRSLYSMMISYRFWSQYRYDIVRITSISQRVRAVCSFQSFQHVKMYDSIVQTFTLSSFLRLSVT